MSKVFVYDFAVEFRPCRLNIVADALSRRDDTDAGLHAMSRPSFDLFTALRRELNDDPDLRAVQDSIVTKREVPWRVMDGLILHDARVFIPAASAALPAILELAHSSGHEGIQKTLHRLRAEFFVEHDRALVRDFV